MSGHVERNDLASIEQAVAEQAHWYDSLDEQGGPYVWYTAWLPIEIFYAAGLTPIMPENYAATAAVRGRAGQTLDGAYRQGYSQDICSYCRQGLGMIEDDHVVTDLPEPDLLVAHRGVCDTHAQWWNEYRRRLDVPTYVVDVPQTATVDDETESDVKYYRDQLAGLRDFIEEQTGEPISDRALWNAIERSDRTSELWRHILGSSRHEPAPITVPDRFKLMGIPALFAGSKRANELLKPVYEEVTDRIDKGIGAAANETYRLMWDNIALWHDLGLFYRLEAEGFAFVADTYSDPFGGLWSIHRYPGESQVDYDRGDPLAAIARAYVRTLQRHDRLDRRLEIFPDWIDHFSIDGVVFHSNRSCRPYSLSQVLVEDSLSVPTTMIEADHTDVAAYSQSQAKLRLDAMKEQIQAGANG